MKYTDGTVENDSSNSLTATVNTSAKVGSISKSAVSTYETWQSGWGTNPDASDPAYNDSDYFYVMWRVNYYNSSSSTQNYIEKITDDASPGEIVAMGSTTNLTPLTTSSSSATLAEYTYNPPSTSYSSRYIYYAVRYDRSLIDPATNTATVSNEAQTDIYLPADHTTSAGTRTSTASITYSLPVNEYSGDAFSVSKSGLPGYIYGGINSILEDESVKLESSRYSFQISTTAKGYSLTYDSQSGSYGVNDYTVNLIDSFVYLGSDRLDTGDYTFTSFYVGSWTEYDRTWNASTGTESATIDADYTNYSPVTVWYKDTTGGSWIQAGTLTRTGSSTYIFTDMGGGNQGVTSGNRVELPASACALKFSTDTNKYQIMMNFCVDFELNPTDHVKALLAAKTAATIYNITSLNAEDTNGNPVSITPTGSIPNTAIQNAIETAEQAEYNAKLIHAYDWVTLTKLSSNTYIAKTSGTYTNDAANEWVRVPYTVNMYEYGSFSSASYTDDAVKAMPGFVPDQTEGVFYDLLPVGAVADASTIRVTTYATNATCGYTVDTVDNWQGSGQTMLIITVTAPNDSNYYFSGSGTSRTLYSGFILRFDLIYTWQNYIDYGNSLLNSIAYRSSTGTLSSGRTAATSSITKRAYFSDSNNDGTDDDTDNNTVYAQYTTNVSVNVSGRHGFSKEVRGPEDLTFGNSAEVAKGGYYTYKLRYSNATTTGISDVVFYDSLDSASSGSDYWQGSLCDIDMSYADQHGYDYTIYYSTQDNLNLSTSSGADADLSDASIWTQLTDSVDLSTVKAIAIDFGATVFNNNDAVIVNIMMQAPTDANAGDVAYNQAIYTSSIINQLLESLTTEVTLKDAEIEISKTADPASGSATSPTLVG